MWKIYETNQLNIIETFQSLEDWKHSIFNQMEIKVKTYFAHKMVSHFDNRMIFQQNKSSHENLMEALSDSEKQMINLEILFPEIKIYWLQEEDVSYVITKNLPEIKSFEPEPKHNLNLLKKNPVANPQYVDELDHKSWSSVAFNINICNYSKGWINYIPSLEERCSLQTKVIIMNTLLKNKEYSLTEEVQLEENITNHKAYKDLYERMLKIMPKINKSLSDEWREAVVSGVVSTTGSKRKNPAS